MKYLLKITGYLYLALTLNHTLFAQGYICAIGGGSEDYNDWSDAPYGWIVEKSDSGKIIIISDSDAASWLPNYFMWLGADTAYNRTIPSTAIANLQSTYDELITAKAIFIRGGDQWDYIRLWKGTKTDSALQLVFNNGGVIAGTSAGAAVLGDVDFSAQSGSVYPDEALQNPFNSYMKFEDNFLDLIPNVLFDTHFIERGRNGRLIGMIYNRYYSAGRDLIGAGIDDKTAICISPDGIGEVMGTGAVSIFFKDSVTRYTPFSSGSYTIENLKSQQLTNGWKYDFLNKQINYIPSSAKDVDINRPWQFPQTHFFLTGSNSISAHLDNLNYFLSTTTHSNILLITHPGFSSSANTISVFLSTNNYNSDIVYLNGSNLNNTTDADKINLADCFIFAGDSLNVLSLLNQTGNLIPDAFQSSMNSAKPVFFFGNTGKISGQNYVGNTDTEFYASYRGKMTLNSGLNLFGELFFQPLLFDNSDFYENRMSAVLWGMMRERKRIGIYLNDNDRMRINYVDKTITGLSSIPYLIIDGRNTTKVDSSTYRASGSVGPRQVVALDELRISLTNYPGVRYLIEDGKFDFLTGVQNENKDLLAVSDFNLYQNYPNPFNPSTTISWKQSKAGKVSITLFDLLGNEIDKLVDDYFDEGIHSKFYIANSKLSSGVYFYRISIQDYSETKSMVLLK